MTALAAPLPSTAVAAPQCLADFRDRHRGETIIVCGCGRSLALLERPERFVTIGVNDVGRQFTPDYLVIVNERRQFDRERYVHIERSQAKAVFTQLDLTHERVVRFRLGRRGGTDRTDPECLHYTNNSPYVAVDLAHHLGARRIGLIGVDFDDDHFFGRTGRHPLAGHLLQIDREYAALAAACRADGVELVNLSPTSRLTSLPRASLDTWQNECRSAPRLFCVHYRFLSCGTVFETGLREAAQTLALASEHADWNDPQLPHKVEHFKPDLLFVVHGRRFVQRWGTRLSAWRSAVWLLDEPYEVDDTAAWSGQFDTVFVNDPASLSRHRHAYELPVAYAPVLHRAGQARESHYRVGFIGGANPSRERLLSGLEGRGLLDYVVGGPWREASLQALCLSSNVPPERTAALYQDTAIIVNVFRDRHHYNRAGLAATAMNPRVCEALACGALVLSEPREALIGQVPELPIFRSEAEAAALVEHFLADPADRSRVQQAAAARLRDATYMRRLKKAIDCALERPMQSVTSRRAASAAVDPPSPPCEAPPCSATEYRAAFDDDWDILDASVHTTAGDEIVIDPGPARGPGVERGLASRARFEAVELAFEACLERGACFLAKVHQVDRIDQTTNSYHLLIDERRAYLARHVHVFRHFQPPLLDWVQLRLACHDGVLTLWRNDKLLHRVRDGELSGGFAFVGAQGGRVRLRGLRLATVDGARNKAIDTGDADELQPVKIATPRLSIVTTVYDRVECLQQCITSVQRLAYRDYEHLVVADHPSTDVIERIRAIPGCAEDPHIGLFSLKRRHNNWGIAPAAAGLRRARGEYLSFLSDDNGYMPDHVDHLIQMLDRDPTLGFVYSSCLYDGRRVLSCPVPRPAHIDLGQPMFRRELFELYLANDLPFNMMAWDWYLIDTLMRRGVRWRHVDRQTFVFRLAKYPHLMGATR
jgi:hypothetical protein